jgi:L-alanine-DL-glutamate epimerase-like enolase superfamily enzyme
VSAEVITAVEVMTIKSPLAVKIEFGPWVMEHREFAFCRIATDGDLAGTAYVYTRDGPIDAFVRRNIAPMYVGQPLDDPASLHWAAAWSNNPILASGLGLRALSLVDLAAWDLAAKAAGKPIARYLGGETSPMPATAIIGYPPTMTAEQVATQVEELYADGWRRFKAPMAATLDESRARLRAAREAVSDDCWLGVDCTWLFKTASEAIEFARSLQDLNLGWIEDVFPPGDAPLVVELREQGGVPVAMGDEQGGAYHPESLITHNAVDVVRLDLTTNGGITRLPGLLAEIADAGMAVSPHMFAHVHSQVYPALGYPDVPIEWGAAGTGVDQFADSLPQPVVENGLMQPLPEAVGLGPQANPAWIADQIVDDPDGVLAKLIEDADAV